MAHVLTELKITPKAQCSEAVTLARDLGLELQAKRYEKPLAEDVFAALTSDEVILWAHHCPTRYFQPPVARGNRSLEEYGFDSVPIEVMRHWKAIKDSYTFDRFEIWTTERTPRASDPLLIGIIGQKLYLLARWGLESPDHLPLRQIAQGIYDERRREAYSRGGSCDYPFQSVERAARSRLLRWREYYEAFAAAERFLGLA